MAPPRRATVRLDLRGLLKFRFLSKDSGDAKMYAQWRARYLGMTRKRFLANSRGGGEWPDLSASTIARRRKGSSSILRDTGTMFGALDLSNASNFEMVSAGIKVGFLGPAMAQDGKITNADLAAIHNFGLGSNPERVIIHEPDAVTINGMLKDLAAAHKRKLGRSSI